MAASLRNQTEIGTIWPIPQIMDIEKRKNAKSVLLHDFGRGSKCLKCGDKCPGFSLHYWRKVCRNCRCRKEDHDIPQEEDPGLHRVGRLFDEPMPTMNYSLPVPRGHPNASISATGQNTVNFAWVPPGVTDDVAAKYMQAFPPEKQPVKGSDADAERRRQIERQIPDHDIDPLACDGLTPKETQLMDDFVNNVKSNVVGQGIVVEQPQMMQWYCFKCNRPMFPGEVAIFAARAGKDKCWHPSCFTCDTCNETLADLIYYFCKDKIFCGRHFAESVYPRCAACDELIFAKEYTMAEGLPWHVKHFCCYTCDYPLAGQKYISKENNPYCLPCYDDYFSKTCSSCRRKIAVTDQRIIHQDFVYHAVPECFHCANCGLPLTNRKFVAKPPKVFCKPECKMTYFGENTNGSTSRLQSAHAQPY